MSRTIIRYIAGCTVQTQRVGLLYRYTIIKENRVVRYGCAFTMWGVKYAARHA